MRPPPDPKTAPAEATADGFSSTVWSLILGAARETDNGPQLNRLCHKYWRPVYVYARRSGLAPCDSEDAAQEFFTYFLARDWLKQADPSRGSFRAFLHTLLRNFLANYRRRLGAQTRAGSAPAISFDAVACESELIAMASADLDAVLAYERSWANCLLQAAMERLATEERMAGKGETFETLRPFLRHHAGAGDYAQAAERLGLSRARVAVLIHRLSRRFTELIRAELMETLTAGADLEAELRHLLNSLAA